MKPIKMVGFDIETKGDLQEYALQPFRALSGKAGISAASVATEEHSEGFLDPTTPKLRNMLTQAIRADYYIVGWNVSFDAAWCMAVGLEEEVFQAKCLEAMLLWRLAVVEPEGENIPRTKRKSYSLKAAMEEFYPSEVGFKDFDDFQADDEESLQLLLHRNKMDALWTLRFAHKFWGTLNGQQQQAALIEARCIPMVAKATVLGLTVDTQAADDLGKKLAQEAVKLYRELLSSSPEVRGINLGSPKQLQKLLYEDWGLPASRFSKKTQLPSTDKYALYDLAAIDPRAVLVKKLRETKNNRVKYAKAIKKSAEYNEDGQTRPVMRIFGTYTGRATYSSTQKATPKKKKALEEIRG